MIKVSQLVIRSIKLETDKLHNLHFPRTAFCLSDILELAISTMKFVQTIYIWYVENPYSLHLSQFVCYKDIIKHNIKNKIEKGAEEE